MGEPQTTTAKDATEFWQHLCTIGGLDVKNYDYELEADIRRYLVIPEKGDFIKLLHVHSVDIENLISAFFHAAAPFADMMSDLLCLFEQANATLSGKNLMIRFHFDKRTDALDFDIRHFRHIKEKVDKQMVRHLFPRLDRETMGSIEKTVTGDLEINFNEKPEDINAQRWMKEYRDTDTWPEFDLELPSTGDYNLDNVLNKLWDIWRAYFKECRRLFKNNRAIHSALRDTTIHSFIPANVFGREIDGGSYRFVQAIFIVIEQLNALTEKEKGAARAEMTNRIKELLDSLQYEEITVEEQIKDIEEFLSLPIWRKRYDVYAAWISTQIIDALKPFDVQYETKGNVLEFSYMGSLIATFQNVCPELQLWAELQTRFDKPIGKGRKAHIRPDYTLAIAPVDDPDSSLAMVECKQYKRSNKKNFSEAIIDYARGREKADVFLVNYGPIHNSVNQEVEKVDLENRVRLFEKFMPQSSLIARFKSQIQNTVAQYYQSVGSCPDLLRFADKPMEISLTWGDKPRDIDLYLCFEPNEEQITVCYNYKDHYPFFSLDRDVTIGGGPEVIRINQWPKGKYTLYACNFSKEAELCDSKAKAVLTSDDYTMNLECPDQGVGDVWCIFQIDLINRTARIQNVISQKIIDQ